MHVRALCFVAAVSVSLVAQTSTASAQEAAEKRFVPDAHFPAPAVLYLSIGNLGRLKVRLAGTLAGRIVTHPGSKRAFAGLWTKAEEKLASEWAPFVDVTGKTPLEVLDLVQGEVSFVLKGLGAGGMPEAALAIELGKGREDILRIRDRVRKAAEEEEGSPFEAQEIEGVRAVAWPLPGGAVLEAVLGTHLVLATSADFLRSIVTAFKGPPGEDAGKRPVGGASRFLDPEAAQQLAIHDRELLFTVNLEVVQAMASAAMSQSADGKEVLKALRVTGVERLTSFGYALGFRDGGMEGAVHLGARDGLGGAMEIVRNAFLPLGDPGEALAQVPAGALEVQATRLAPGKMLHDLDRLIRDGYPEAAGDLDKAYETLERAAGISVERDIFPLGELTLYAFAATPPAGGIFADQVILARTEALGPYWKLLEKAAAVFGSGFESLESSGGKVEYVNLASGVAGESNILEAILSGGIDHPSFTEVLGLALAGAGGVVARADLPGGWTAVSNLPQAVIRHVEHYAKGRKISEDAEWAALARARFPGASVAAVSRGGKSLLAAYNTILSLASAFSAFAAMAGIDLARLPPAESFLDAARPGFLRVVMGPAGFTLHGHRAFEGSSGVIAAVGGGAILAGFLVPTLMRGRGEAYAVQCANNLRQLYGVSLQYSNEAGGNAFPHSPEGSLVALQMLSDFAGADLPAKVFLCPEGDETEPTTEDGKPVLTEKHCSYEIVPWRLKNTTPNAILLHDRAPHHHGKRNVLMSDGAINAVEEAEFQEMLASQRERFSRKAAPPAGEDEKEEEATAKDGERKLKKAVKKVPPREE